MITVLMATYNGEKYLAEQIESILAQSAQDFVLHILDDASSDGSFAIAEQYAQTHPDKITAERCEKNSGSAKYTFLRLAAKYQDDYVMFCDQDDVWMPEKIAHTLACMQAAEARNGRDVPILVHTDMTVVRADMSEMADSFWAYGNMPIHRTRRQDIAMQNVVTGCSAMYNRAMSVLLKEAPAAYNMHDWWVALLAATFGRIEALDEATLNYRQHGNNVVGAKKVRSLGYMLHRLRNGQKVRADLQSAYDQAGSLLALYGDRMDEETRAFFTAFSAIPAQGKLARLIAFQRLGVWKGGLARKLGQIVFG